MARTRSTKTADAPAEPAPTTTSKISLTRSENPSKIFVLPSKASPDARIVTLPNPRHARPARYLVCLETGIYEFTKIATPKATPRSWLIENGENADISMGQELYMATLIDPVFLVLPALTEQTKGSEKRLFLSSDDHFDHLPEESSHLSEILRCEKTRKLIESRMGAVCDTVEAGDETMFRINNEKLVNVILEKARRLGQLPASMEEKFVKKALEAPVLAQKRELKTETSQPTTETVDTPADSTDSQSTTTDTQPSTATSFTTITDDVVTAIQASPEVTSLQRLRVAFSFICSSYIAPSLATELQTAVEKAVDFSSLDDYLSKLAKFRAEAMASHSLDYSRKRDRDEEEDEASVKRRKAEEEKKKRSMESRGVRELKKVNTKGMKKMSDFFKKK
ncbi:Ribonuclease H2 subunit B [Fusarium sp. LHS14.1]|nr:Ribonuclease H2 subunit B [Fusarium sp. LHS14.1]